MKPANFTYVPAMDRRNWRAKWAKLPGVDTNIDPDKFYPVPNRAAKRARRFGGVRAEDGSRPARSRIQRGKSRPGQRGTVIRNGLHPVFVDRNGDRIDMNEFGKAVDNYERNA